MLATRTFSRCDGLPVEYASPEPSVLFEQVNDDRCPCLPKQVHRQQGAGESSPDDGDPGSGRDGRANRTRYLHGPLRSLPVQLPRQPARRARTRVGDAPVSALLGGSSGQRADDIPPCADIDIRMESSPLRVPADTTLLPAAGSVFDLLPIDRCHQGGSTFSILSIEL